MSWLDKLFGTASDRDALDNPMRIVSGLPDFDHALRAPVAVIYKHSPICGISNWARIEVRQFAAEHPEIPVLFLDVVRQRLVSNEIERRLGVRHESPQVILLRDGTAAWHASHGGVSDAALRAALLASPPDPEPANATP